MDKSYNSLSPLIYLHYHFGKMQMPQKMQEVGTWPLSYIRLQSKQQLCKSSPVFGNVINEPRSWNKLW